MSERVLVCLLQSTRAARLTFGSFKRHVLDELEADLSLAITLDDAYDYTNPYWQNAKYRWSAPDYEDYGQGYDLVQKRLCQRRGIEPPDWRLTLRLNGIWKGRIKAPDPEPSASSIQFFCRWLLLEGLRSESIINRYDRFVISRSDFIWTCPHPPLSILDPEKIWTPHGQSYGGVNDRHLVVSRADLVNCLNVLEDILLFPHELYNEMKHHSDWNNERIFAAHLGRKGMLSKLKTFPYVMYLARSPDDQSVTWSPGFPAPAGHFVKYPAEYRSATAYANVIRSRRDWEVGAWKQLDLSVRANPKAPGQPERR